ncbi:MAG: glycoside hydrolase [Acidobacteria bacterium]|nr:glycoside hydrolase [Acidobacteriota bacterium]
MRALLLLVIAFSLSTTCAQVPSWPEATRESRPWSYWWWPGSAVDEANITRELQRYRAAGWGGVHIIPIYGVKGAESRFIDYLSPRWMAVLKHTVTEAGRLGMGVDMTIGTGWCFGGPEVTEIEAAAVVVSRKWELTAGAALPERIDKRTTQALEAFSSDGAQENLLPLVQDDGAVRWTAGAGGRTVYLVSQKPSGSRVKRAAPGGAGFMLNPFFGQAARHYMERFTRAFAAYDGPLPRAMYHDSFEYAVNWSPDLFEEFEKRRGYRLQRELPSLLGASLDDRTARVKADYRLTASEQLSDNFLPVWTSWCRARGILTRNQAHGSPGNLLDLYAAADIPETEMFNADRSTIISKFASSAAHVSGRKLVASETGTWLREHFTETLADVKNLLDQLWLSGVNHVIYHGTCYSPDDAAWPGWLFYASTEMNPRNPIWRDVPALNSYIARVQAVLQEGRPANDVLLYWPVSDVWHDPQRMTAGLTVHTRTWVEAQEFGKLAQRLLQRGYAADYISDRQLAGARAAGGDVEVAGGRYRALVIPATRHIPLETMRRLAALSAAGARVIFDRELPADVSGLRDLEAGRSELNRLRSGLKAADAEHGRRARDHVGSRAGVHPPAGRRRTLVLHRQSRADPDRGLDPAGRQGRVGRPDGPAHRPHRLRRLARQRRVVLAVGCGRIRHRPDLRWQAQGHGMVLLEAWIWAPGIAGQVVREVHLRRP